MQSLKNSNSVWIVAYNAEKEHLLCGGENGNVFVWHLPSSTLLHDIDAHNGALSLLEIIPFINIYSFVCL